MIQHVAATQHGHFEIKVQLLRSNIG